MTDVDYVSERHKLLEELRPHHTAPTYVGLPERDIPRRDTRDWVRSTNPLHPRHD